MDTKEISLTNWKFSRTTSNNKHGSQTTTMAHRRLATTYAQRYQQTTKLSILATDEISSLVGKQQRYDIFDDDNNNFGQPMLPKLATLTIGSTKSRALLEHVAQRPKCRNIHSTTSIQLRQVKFMYRRTKPKRECFILISENFRLEIA